MYTRYVYLIDVVCFKKQEYSVNEGDMVAVTLTLSTPLQQPLTVQLGYENVSPSSTSKSFTAIRKLCMHSYNMFKINSYL